MTKLLEIKEKLEKFYSEYETYVKPALKFIGFLVMYLIISSNIGYNPKVNSIVVTVVLALVGCLLPTGFTVFLASIVILLDLYALSIETAVIGLIIFILLFVLYFRFSSKNGVMALVTPVLLKFNIPYIVPIGTGLMNKPYAIVPSLCGTVVYFFLRGVHLSASTLNSDVVIDGEETAKYTLSVNQLINNKEMFLYVGMFIVTAILVYVVRRLKIDHAWTIATVVGVVVQLLGFIIGFLVLNISGGIAWLFLGNIVALLLGMALQFLFMNLDYARTERTQFEDDDYYYYVKAVPKKMVAKKEVTVKKFGTTTAMAKRVPKDLDLDDEDNTEVDKITRQVIAKELDINEDLLK